MTKTEMARRVVMVSCNLPELPAAADARVVRMVLKADVQTMKHFLVMAERELKRVGREMPA